MTCTVNKTVVENSGKVCRRNRRGLRSRACALQKKSADRAPTPGCSGSAWKSWVRKVRMRPRERPSARWGILVWVEQNNQPLYRRFLQPNVSDMEQTAYEAADFVLQEINRRKVEALFEDTIDLAKDEL